jgi:outer membrane protein OmpA-like peptidoglycan-associated protein
METSRTYKGLLLIAGVLIFITMCILSGCATKEFVGQQITPVSDRVTQTETRIGKTEGQITQLDSRLTADEGKISAVDSNVSKVDAKADRALSSLSNLKIERRFVLAVDKKEGANFDFKSSKLTDKAMKEIDAFLNEVPAGDNVVFLVAGYTDSRGSEDVNYALGKHRAEAVSRYLITQKKLDPLRVVTTSYGKDSPIADNKTKEGRAQNRRVEIVVYRDVISSSVAPQK